MPINVSVLTPKELLFEGEARSIVLPGEQGEFEIQPFHQPILSRLVSGTVHIDSQKFQILRGIVKVIFDTVTIIIEEK
ncbi:MAG: F0F1 ATP synthase subunit epsilon [Candidatus Omnitrophica bacterium]|nr:F0F1 ATP synthase subunit epsilon [Candidatus Omnitrophota bacterium]